MVGVPTSHFGKEMPFLRKTPQCCTVMSDRSIFWTTSMHIFDPSHKVPGTPDLSSIYNTSDDIYKVPKKLLHKIPHPANSDNHSTCRIEMTPISSYEQSPLRWNLKGRRSSMCAVGEALTYGLALCRIERPGNGEHRIVHVRDSACADDHA